MWMYVCTTVQYNSTSIPGGWGVGGGALKNILMYQYYISYP